MYYDLLDVDITFEASLAYVEKVLKAYEEDKFPFPPVKENLEFALDIVDKVFASNSKINKFIVYNENRRRNKVSATCAKLKKILTDQLSRMENAEKRFNEELPNFNEMSHDELKEYVIKLMAEKSGPEKKPVEPAQEEQSKPEEIKLEIK